MPDGDGPTTPDAGPAPQPGARRRGPGGVSVIAGGLLQDLEERLRRDLAPVELRVRPGEELRGLAGDAAGSEGEDPLVIVLPPPDAGDS